MNIVRPTAHGEPWIAVGLVQHTQGVAFQLSGEFQGPAGQLLAAGEYQAKADTGGLLSLPGCAPAREITLTPLDPANARFALEATIGIDFHWQQREMQTFCGKLRLKVTDRGALLVINDVPLESYILSVICSEMNAASPAELARAHAVISRSWLLAQLQSEGQTPGAASLQVEGQEKIPAQISRYYDREAHTDFDVCADDHCQRYQGTARIRSGTVYDAISATRGLVMTHAGLVCDSRFSKCCGGVSEDFRVAWSDRFVPYLVPVFDGNGVLPEPPLNEERALRDFLAEDRSDIFCNCRDERILSQVLNSYDRNTPDFYRWKVRLTAEEAGSLFQQKTGIDLGRILAMEPVERGISGRLKRLRFVGEKGRIVIGKELEIRRALSPSHLYSSAFVVDPEGPISRPDHFVLHGAGWGHGVGLCQIGAAVMACRGMGYEEILRHYYPGTELTRIYR